MVQQCGLGSMYSKRSQSISHVDAGHIAAFDV